MASGKFPDLPRHPLEARGEATSQLYMTKTQIHVIVYELEVTNIKVSRHFMRLEKAQLVPLSFSYVFQY